MQDKKFEISVIGNTNSRTTLGATTSVEIFRLVKTALADIIGMTLGEVKGDEAIYNAGKAVGGEIGRVFLAEVKSLDEFVKQVSKLLVDLTIGVLSVVKADVNAGQFVLRVDECVSCSGTPNIGNPICFFEGGVISGLMKHFLQKENVVKETKCFGLGDQFCEFDIQVK